MNEGREWDVRSNRCYKFVEYVSSIQLRFLWLVWNSHITRSSQLFICFQISTLDRYYKLMQIKIANNTWYTFLQALDKGSLSFMARNNILRIQNITQIRFRGLEIKWTSSATRFTKLYACLTKLYDFNNIKAMFSFFMKGYKELDWGSWQLLRNSFVVYQVKYLSI